MKELTPDLLQEFSRSYAQKDGAQTLHTMLYKTDMADLSYVPLKGAALKGAFFRGSKDPRHYGPGTVRSMLAVCGPKHPPRKGGGKMQA